MSRLVSGASAGVLLSQPISVTPGEAIAITIGSGGGENQGGGSTSFGTYITCTGGYAPTLATLTYGGNCGASYGGAGHNGQFLGIGDGLGTTGPDYGGHLAGGESPLSYGSGGYANKCWGCGYSNLSWGMAGNNGVVIVDVLY